VGLTEEMWSKISNMAGSSDRSDEKSRNASACLRLLREKCDIITVGNHDLHAAGIAPVLPEAIRGLDTWEHELDLDPGYSAEDISFLSTLPLYYILSTPAGRILFSHYVYPNLDWAGIRAGAGATHKYLKLK